MKVIIVGIGRMRTLVYGRCLTQMGTEKESFVELTERIGRKTGGLSVSPFTSDVKGRTDPAAYLMLRGKAVVDKTPDLLDLFHDILHTARLDDQNRFKQVLHPTYMLLTVLCLKADHSHPAYFTWALE